MKLKINKKYHCFFEQSGTFKNEFKKLGYEAYDYDILNDFGETDYVIDLFSEIKKTYDDEASIFDEFTEEDTILAFFPCIRFEDQIQMGFRGTMYQQKNWSLVQKLEYDLKLHEELTFLYQMVTKLAIVCIRRNIPLIIENPYSTTHYLVKYWCIPYTILDMDRTMSGDYQKKPTQYWFINCEPKRNFIFEPLLKVERRVIEFQKNENGVDRQVLRSMIHPQYANRFIREFILEEA